jgi:hypothetical protein
MLNGKANQSLRASLLHIEQIRMMKFGHDSGLGMAKTNFAIMNAGLAAWRFA